MGTPPQIKSYNAGILGGWNVKTGKATGVGAIDKWVSSWSPFASADRREAAGVDHEAWKAQQHLEGVAARADRNAVDLSDQQARQVANAARRRQGRGLSSTFVSGRGGGTLLGGG